MTDPARIFVLGSFVNACCADVAVLPRPGESLLADRFSSEPGGKGFNVAAGARRLGAMVDCLAAIGDDLFGQLAEQAFTAAGLATHLLRRYPTQTGAGIGFISANGENCVAVYPGANLSLSAEDARAAALNIVAAAMTVAQFEIADAPILEAFAIARAAGRQTLLNPSPFRGPGRELLAQTSILVVNEGEAAALADALGIAEDDSVLAAMLHVQGPELLVVTRGAHGARAYRRGEAPVTQPAFVVDAIDTLGAGDAFAAALAVGLAGGMPLPDSLRRAAAAGALMASRRRTFGAFPAIADVDELLRGGQTHADETIT